MRSQESPAIVERIGSSSVPAVARRARGGFTLLEFIVALLLFGLAMSGLFPLVIMYSKVLESLEQRPDKLALHRNVGVDDDTYRAAHSDEWYQVGAGTPNAGEWVHKWHLVPFSDSGSSGSNAWARKLGSGASIKYATPTSTIEIPVTVPMKATATEPAGVDATAPLYYAESPPPTDPDHPWTLASGAYYNGTAQQSPATAAGIATWTLTVASDGWYQLQATGVVPGSMPVGCSYALSTDSGANWSPPMTPNLTFGASSTWQPLAMSYYLAGTVMIQLTTGVNSGAIADGMRLVPCAMEITSFSLPTATTASADVEIRPAVRATE